METIDITTNLQHINRKLEENKIITLKSRFPELFIIIQKAKNVDIEFYELDSVDGEIINRLVFDETNPAVSMKFNGFGKVVLTPKGKDASILLSAIALNGQCKDPVYLNTEEYTRAFFRKYPDDGEYQLNEFKKGCVFFSYYPSISLTIVPSLSVTSDSVLIVENGVKEPVVSGSFLIDRKISSGFLKFNVSNVEISDHVSIYAQPESRSSEFLFSGIVQSSGLTFARKIEITPQPTQISDHKKSNYMVYVFVGCLFLIVVIIVFFVSFFNRERIAYKQIPNDINPV